MEKEFERKQKLKQMDEEHRKEAEKKHDEEVKKHKDHPKVIKNCNTILFIFILDNSRP